MRLGIMQPYFFPYLEHFRLIAACDQWLVFDTVKYQRRSWMNRNRVLNRDTGWAYVQMPVSKKERGLNVADTRVRAPEDWTGAFFDKLRVYEKEAPHYTRTVEVLAATLEQVPTTLAAANTRILRALCDYLGIDTPIRRVSELPIELPEHCEPGRWALEISRAMGADEYRNPSGGRDIFDPELYARHGITLSFHAHRDFQYPTGSFEFVPDLSIIDPMMWVDHDRLRAVILDRD